MAAVRVGSVTRRALRAAIPGLVGSTLVVTGLLSGQAATLPTFPGASSSHYLAVADDHQLSAVGRRDARAAARTGLSHALIVLDAGEPAGGTSLRLAGTRRVVSIDSIGRAATAYGQAWIRTAGHPALTLVLAVAAHGGHVDRGAGAAWARMVSQVAQRLAGVDVRGGLDVEIEWGPAIVARSWLTGYLGTTERPVVDIGSCTCPPLSRLPAGWSRRALADIVSAGGRGSALPQIYATAGGNAIEWAALASWAHRHHRPAVRLLGVLTQQSACLGPPRRACVGIDVSPARAWAQLAGASHQRLRFATDIGYLPVPPKPAGMSAAGRSLLIIGLLFVAAAVTILLDGLRRRRRRRRI